MHSPQFVGKLMLLEVHFLYFAVSKTLTPVRVTRLEVDPRFQRLFAVRRWHEGLWKVDIGGGPDAGEAFRVRL